MEIISKTHISLNFMQDIRTGPFIEITVRMNISINTEENSWVNFWYLRLIDLGSTEVGSFRHLNIKLKGRLCGFFKTLLNTPLVFILGIIYSIPLSLLFLIFAILVTLLVTLFFVVLSLALFFTVLFAILFLVSDVSLPPLLNIGIGCNAQKSWIWKKR